MIAKLTGVSGIGGTVGNTTFGSNQGTYQARRFNNKRAGTKNPNSSAESTLKYWMNVWSTGLSSGVKAGWTAWAGATPWQWGLPPNDRVDGPAWFYRNAQTTAACMDSYDLSLYPGYYGATPVLAIQTTSYYGNVIVDGNPVIGWSIDTTINRYSYDYNFGYGFGTRAPSLFRSSPGSAPSQLVQTGQGFNGGPFSPGDIINITMADNLYFARVYGSNMPTSVFCTWDMNVSYDYFFRCPITL